MPDKENPDEDSRLARITTQLEMVEHLYPPRRPAGANATFPARAMAASRTSIAGSSLASLFHEGGGYEQER